jgi:trimeric autotransporter adhesin
MDNVNTITNTVNFKRWADSGGVFGYYDWLDQNQLAPRAVPGLTVDFPSKLHNSAIVTVPYGEIIPQLKINLYYGRGTFSSSSTSSDFIPAPNYIGLDLSLEGSFGIGPIAITAISLTGDYVEISYLSEVYIFPIDNPEALKNNLVDLGLSDEQAESVSVEFFDILDRVNQIADEVRDLVTDRFVSPPTAEFSESQGAITADLTSGVVSSSTSGVSIGIGSRDNLIGTAYGDEINGSALANVLFGSVGTDTITGGNGFDSIFGGADNDFIYERSDMPNQDDGGVLAGGSGNDLIDVSASVDQSSIYGGSGDDTLIGNGASILYGGSGADEFRVLTTSSTPGSTGDRIVGTEAADTLWIDGIQVTENSPDIIYGIEIGGPGGGPFYLPQAQGGRVLEIGDIASAPLAIVFRVSGLAEDFSGLRQDILLDLYIYKDVSVGPISGIGPPNANEQFFLSDAVTVIRGVHLGDFGLFLLDGPSAFGLTVSTGARDRLVHDGVKYFPGDLAVGPPRTLSEDEIEEEALLEKFREMFEDNPQTRGPPVSSSSGSSGSDIILGDGASGNFSSGDGDDQVFGGGGSDTVLIGFGNDVASGGEGSDILTGGDGDDIIFGDVSPVSQFEIPAFEGADSISGGNGADSIYGNGGADTLHGDDGNDKIDGGDGDDVAFGGSGDDSIIGGAGLDLINGDDGKDTLKGGSGADTIFGGDGDDEASGGDGSDTIYGGSGNDRVIGGSGFNKLSGDIGSDTLVGAVGFDTLDGGIGNDSLEGGAGFDRYIYRAGDGSDVIYDFGAFTDDDVLEFVDVASAAASYRRVNNDLVISLQDGSVLTIRQHYRVSNSAVETALFSGGVSVNLERLTVQTYLQGTDGDDILTGINSTTAEIAYAGGGNDSISSSGGNDTIFGEAGNDTLNGGAGSDSMMGGTGDDSYVVDLATDLVIEAVGEGSDSVTSSISLVLAANVENLTLSGTSGLSGTGNALANVLTGNGGANVLSGLDGSDTLIGGGGNDTYDVDNIGDVVTELAGGGTDLIRASLSWTLGIEVENLTLMGTTNLSGTGNALANRLTGNAGANALSGGDGNDTLDAGTGNDTLNGGLGNDSMIGGAGDDLFIVDAASDIVSEASASGNDTVQASVTYTLAANVETLELTGSAAINGTGNTLANTIRGNGAANLLSGGTGNDTITGGGGNDTLVADAAGDVLIEAAGEGIDLVQSSVNWTLGAEFENLTLSGTSGLSGTGSALANVLTGNSGANVLSGLDGSDTLIGGGGNDSLNGGNGADQFVFTSTASGVDVIADFNELNGGGEEGDVLRFDALRVGTFVYRGTSAFTGGSDNSEARVSGSQVLVDTNGDGTADITITLTGLTAATQLATSDFVFL